MLWESFNPPRLAMPEREKEKPGRKALSFFGPLIFQRDGRLPFTTVGLSRRLAQG